MEEDDPRRELDRFTLNLVGKMRAELEVAILKLISSDADMARAQVDVLQQGALRRLKNIDFEHDMWMSEMSPSEPPEEEILKTIRIVIAELDQTFDSVREIITDRDADAYGGDPTGEPPA